MDEKQKLPSNVTYDIQDYLDELGELKIDTTLDVRIVPSQRAQFEGMYVEVNGDYTVQFDITYDAHGYVISSTDEDGKVTQFEL